MSLVRGGGGGGRRKANISRSTPWHVVTSPLRAPQLLCMREKERESLDDLESLDLGMEYEELGMDLVMERANWPTGGCYVLQSPEGLMRERERERRETKKRGKEGVREAGEERSLCV